MNPDPSWHEYLEYRIKPERNKLIDCGEAGSAEGRCGTTECLPSFKQEPVEWQGNAGSGWRDIAPTKREPTQKLRAEYLATVKNAKGEPAYEIRALYTSPPQRQPLTEGQINGLRELSPLDEICITGVHDGWVIEFARALEVAHDIKAAK